MKFYETLDVGDEFYEEDYGQRIRLQVTEGTTIKMMESEGRRQFVWKAIEILDLSDVEYTGREIEYLITEGYEHYGPNVYQ